jgi:hypothetical protein
MFLVYSIVAIYGSDPLESLYEHAHEHGERVQAVDAISDAIQLTGYDSQVRPTHRILYTTPAQRAWAV